MSRFNIWRFLTKTGKFIVILIALVVVLALTREVTDLMRRSRQPLNVEVTDTDSPFSVSDRQERTRTWIDERLEQE